MKAFPAVREAVCQNLEKLQLTILGPPSRGEWQDRVVCPLCDDQSGSASVSRRSGHLKCHQCGESQELFSWYATAHGLPDTWAACTALAESYSVTLQRPKRKSVRLPTTMDEDAATKAVRDLLSLPEAEEARQFLRRRKLLDPEFLELYRIGWAGDCITFPQFYPSGEIKQRYRRYYPQEDKSRCWRWSGGAGRPQGLWPGVKPSQDGILLILEGEWDVLTAAIRLRCHSENIWPYTWTGGAGASISARDLPHWFRGRRVILCYDNDVYQGPDPLEHKAPDERRRLEMLRRRRALVLGTGRALDSFGCKVEIAAVPIDPLVKWGGDLRDWVDAGGADIWALPRDSITAVIAQHQTAARECEFPDVAANAGHRVRFRCAALSIDTEEVTVPSLSAVDCRIGFDSVCDVCRVPEKFGDQAIRWDEHLEDLATWCCTSDPERRLVREMLGKPSRCSYCRIRTEEYFTGHRWRAIAPEEGTEGPIMTVVSEKFPVLAGTNEVVGRAIHHGPNVVVIADQLEEVEPFELELGERVDELRDICPWDDPTPSDIDAYFQHRVRDLALNVTHSYGRRPLHQAIDLLAHSALWMKVDQHTRRAWLDICVIGDTSTAKSITFRHYIEHVGLGKIFSCMENVSRAGLTMGASQDGHMRPGLFPRMHKQMLALDEFHILVERSQQHPMLHLQSARDEGVVHGIKIYGSRQLPAAVRLAVIGNWSKGRVSTFRHPCQHIGWLYGPPEAIRRLDFGLTVTGELDYEDPEAVSHIWNRSLMRGLILRAWSMDPAQIHILPTAMELSREIVDDWTDRFERQELPLFTGVEKLYSLLRIAISVANICFSHRRGSVFETVVRSAHVEWAAEWLLRLWRVTGYAEYSEAQRMREALTDPTEVEYYLTSKLRISSADQAVAVMDQLFGQVSVMELAPMLGLEAYEMHRWVGEMVRRRAMERVRIGPRTEVRLTKGGHALIRRMLRLANGNPEAFENRIRQVRSWVATKLTPMMDLSDEVVDKALGEPHP